MSSHSLTPGCRARATSFTLAAGRRPLSGGAAAHPPAAAPTPPATKPAARKRKPQQPSAKTKGISLLTPPQKASRKGKQASKRARRKGQGARRRGQVLSARCPYLAAQLLRLRLHLVAQLDELRLPLLPLHLLVVLAAVLKDVLDVLEELRHAAVALELAGDACRKKRPSKQERNAQEKRDTKHSKKTAAGPSVRKRGILSAQRTNYRHLPGGRQAGRQAGGTLARPRPRPSSPQGSNSRGKSNPI